MWIDVCASNALAPGKVQCVDVEGMTVAVFRLGSGELRAVEDRCPHRGAPLSRGLLYDGDKVACLDHGWSIRLIDGGVEPPERGCVRVFEAKEEGGMVRVQVA
jgi:nitrite reductase (NADH) small subunit